MLEEWYALGEPTEEAAWWIRKSGGDHYAEHLDRLASGSPSSSRAATIRDGIGPFIGG